MAETVPVRTDEVRTTAAYADTGGVGALQSGRRRRQHLGIEILPRTNRKDSFRKTRKSMHQKSTIENFLSRVEKTPTCWLWTGHRNKVGYGTVGWAGKIYMVHRVSYQHFKGPIPSGLTLDHLCRIKNCVNPDHLEPCSAAENARRGNCNSAVNSRKTHCIRGHEFNDDNTYRYVYGRRVMRNCRKCRGVDIEGLKLDKRKPCTYAGCTTLTTWASGHCERHYKKIWRLKYFQKTGSWE
jgi:hypothetical protein